MATRDDILTARAAAGADYQTKLAALRTALVELAAHDAAAASNATGLGDPTVPAQPAHSVRSFGVLPQNLALAGLVHPEFPATSEAADIFAAIAARRDQIVATIS